MSDPQKARGRSLQLKSEADKENRPPRRYPLRFDRLPGLLNEANLCGTRKPLTRRDDRRKTENLFRRVSVCIPDKPTTAPKKTPVKRTRRSSLLNNRSTANAKKSNYPSPYEDGVTACLIVIDPDIESPVMRPNRVRMIPEFVEEAIHPICTEARLGNIDGKYLLPYRLPGIPSKKFGPTNIKEYDVADKNWPVQAVYKDKDGNLRVYYEGWTSHYRNETTEDDVNQDCPERLKEFDVRQKFIDAMKVAAEKQVAEEKRARSRSKKRMSKDEEDELMRKLFLETDPCSDELKDPRNRFWCYEDLTYFHTTINREDADLTGLVFYMVLVELDPSSNLKPPKYVYTGLNITQRNVYDWLLAQKINKPFSEILGDSIPVLKQIGACPSEDCMCDIKFKKLYKDSRTHNLKYNANGLLDLSEYNSETGRIVVECSDECGCDSKCPRRRMQQGQTAHLVINYERELGFGVRAASDIKAGDFICEYTGELLEKEEEEEPKKRRRAKIDQNRMDSPEEMSSQQSSSSLLEPSPVSAISTSSEKAKKPSVIYDAEFSTMYPGLIIRALNFGNVARFINHGCKPNATFIEVHSRVRESDPLIPRIAVYALHDIAIGETISISYWSKEQFKTLKKSGVRCRCGAGKGICHEILPGY